MSAAFQPPRIAALAVDFQGELDRLIAERPPRVLRLWPWLGAGIVATLVGLSSLLPVDIVVTASGELAADAPPVLLKPMTRAVLREILVRPGDHVTAGQLLARLDPTLPAADRAALRAERASVLAEIGRLEAELRGEPLSGGSQEDAIQADLQTRRADLARAQRERMLNNAHALAEQLGAAHRVTVRLRETVEIAREREDKRLILAEKHLIPELEALDSRALRLAAENDLAAHEAKLSETERALQSALAEIEVFDLALQREAAEALPALQLRLIQLDDALEKAERLTMLSDLVAPRDAVVVSVSPGGVGAVMAEGEPIIALIPSDARMIAEIDISSGETGRIALGDPVTLKIDAFPWRRNGAALGQLESISPATLASGPDGVTRHPARVSLSSVPDALPAGAALLPGMTLTAEIRTGTRSVLDFFLDPLLRGLSESLREP